MGNGLVLSVFPGIDLLGRAFEEQEYCVVRGPDLLWGGVKRRDKANPEQARARKLRSYHKTKGLAR